MYHNKCSFKSDEGKRVALMRHIREMSQLELANRVGKSVGYIAGVEAGRTIPKDMSKLAKALGVTEEYLKKGGAIQEHLTRVW